MEKTIKEVIIKKIKLTTSIDVKEFVWTTTQFKGKVIRRTKTQEINCKSILGIYSLNLSEPFDVEFRDTYDENPLFDKIKRWEVK